MKKLVTLFLAILTACGLLVLSASAEGFTYEFESHSKSLFMVDMNSGEVIYSKNPDEKLPMASLTKIMSYIVAYENIPDIETTKITVSPTVEKLLSGTGSSLADIEVGEEFTGVQLLNLMMVPSGNDAAMVLAQYVDEQKGGTADTDGVNMTNSAFVKLMNEKAAALGCTSTNFTNPHGLHSENHYTTARDYAAIARYATTLPYFSDIVNQNTYTLEPTNKRPDGDTYYATNRMLSQYADEGKYYYTYATGMKTGYHDQAGYCIAASGLHDGYSYIVIALGSPSMDAKGEDIDVHGEMLDAKALLKWAFLNIESKTIAAKGDLVGEVVLQYAWGKDRLQVVAENNVQALLPGEVSVSSILVTTDMPEKVQAPVKKGDVLGTATFSYADEPIATINVVAAESVERSELVQTVEVGKEVVTSPIFLVIGGLILIILLVYLTSVWMYNKKKKKMRKVKKYRDL